MTTEQTSMERLQETYPEMAKAVRLMTYEKGEVPFELCQIIDQLEELQDKIKAYAHFRTAAALHHSRRPEEDLAVMSGGIDLVRKAALIHKKELEDMRQRFDGMANCRECHRRFDETEGCCVWIEEVEPGSHKVLAGCCYDCQEADGCSLCKKRFASTWLHAEVSE